MALARLIPSIAYYLNLCIGNNLKCSLYTVVKKNTLTRN